MTENLYQEDRLLQRPFADGDRIVRLWEAKHPRAVIVAIHGGMSHSGDYATVGAYFRAQEVTTISFDLTCFSDGTFDGGIDRHSSGNQQKT
jgi:alpha-beta hydrolase superfamily lysophospholipase